MENLNLMLMTKRIVAANPTSYHHELWEVLLILIEKLKASQHQGVLIIFVSDLICANSQMDFHAPQYQVP